MVKKSDAPRVPPAKIANEHEKFLYPAVRVLAQSAEGSGIGSGVVVYSQGGKSYILTNHHVISNLIKIETEWDAVAGRNLKKETRLPAFVEFFQYSNWSRVDGTRQQKARIVGWSEETDLALLEIDQAHDHIAQIATAEEYEECLYTRDEILTVGCGLGVIPFATDGTLASKEHYDIGGKPYLMCTAPSIFGNSGGPVFSYHLEKIIGLTARISINILGWSASAVTHMGWAIPASTIHDFLREQIYDFIVDPKRTPAQCEKERENLRKKSLEAQRLGTNSDDEEDD